MESVPTKLRLTDGQAHALAALGEKLVSNSVWWGTPDSTIEEERLDARTAIRCHPTSDGYWSVTIVDAVGVVSAGDVQIVAHPKIPTSHLLYLFSRTEKWPRFDEDIAKLAANENLLEVVAHWFLNAVEGLLRLDLIKDYRPMRDELVAMRGQVDAGPTALAYYSGRLGAVCDFEEFDTDIPLNRILKAAAMAVARSPQIGWIRRRRAVRVIARMDDVGDLEHSDLTAQPDIRSGYYRDPLLLARHLLKGLGRTIEAGGEQAWGFLVRTPALAEDALRSVLASGLKHRCRVKRASRRLEGSLMTLNPDLQFLPYPAVGDVKYRLISEWRRSDIYQGTAFATGFRVADAAVVSFQVVGDSDLPKVKIGDVSLVFLPWLIADDLHPEASERQLLAFANNWLDGISPTLEAVR